MTSRAFFSSNVIYSALWRESYDPIGYQMPEIATCDAAMVIYIELIREYHGSARW